MGKNGDSYLEDLAHERVIWKMQRWGWAILTLILLAALVGLLGHGALSKAKAGQPGSGFWAEYDRFGRYQAPAVLKAHVGTAAAKPLPAIWFAQDYIDAVEIERIYPAPEQVKAAHGRLIYIFNIARTNEHTEIAFHLKPSGFGKKSVRMGLVDGPELQFSQFIYP